MCEGRWQAAGIIDVRRVRGLYSDTKAAEYKMLRSQGGLLEDQLLAG